MRKKVIFLDFDGVMNSNRYYTEYDAEERASHVDEFGDGFDPDSRSYLNKLIDETGAEIVISAGARHNGLDEMIEMWKKRKMSGTVVGITPYIRSNGFSIPRGVEISEHCHSVYKYWSWTHDLERREYRSPYELEQIKACTLDTYVIIDDDDDMLYEHRYNFVKCDPLEGFVESDYAKALAILNKKPAC